MYEKTSKNETIWRWGIAKETLEHLEITSQEAYEIIGIHGVSAFSSALPDEIKKSFTSTEQLSKAGFHTYITPLDATPEHRTITIPQPLTHEIVKKWNKIWRRN